VFKNSLSICYIFFAINDVIVSSVNTYTSVMGFSTEDLCKKTKTRMWANARCDGRPAIGGVLCSTPQSLADAHC